MSGIVHGAALLWVTLWLAGCAMGFNPQRMPEMVEIPAEGVTVPIEVVQNLPFVQVSVNGSKPLWFLIDTGAYTVIIDDDAAAGARLKREMRFGTHSTAAGDHFGRMDLVKFDQLRVGGAAFGGFEGLVTDLAPLRDTVEHPFDGVIGIPLLHKGVWAIDYPNASLQIVDSMPALADDPKTMPFMWSGETPAITLQIGDVELAAEIDTGSTNGLNLDEVDAQRVPLANDGITIKFQHKTLSGTVWEESRKLDATLRIGSIEMETPMVNLGRDTMFGGEILRDCIFTIDCARQVVRIEKVETPGAGRERN